MSGAAIANAIRSHSFHFSNEKQLQAGIAAVLEGAGVKFAREVPLLDADRIDFLCGRIGIEVKIAGGSAAVTRQLHRYSQRPEIDELILVSSRLLHRYALPESLNGKPLRVVSLVRL